MRQSNSSSGQGSVSKKQDKARKSARSRLASAIKGMFEALISAFAKFAEESGQSREAARGRAERVVAMLHGSLVLSRGLGSNAPFKNFLNTLAADLIGPPAGPPPSTHRRKSR